MKILVFAPFIMGTLLAGCLSMVGNDEKIASKTLRDGSIIELDYFGGGATAPDVIWVSRTLKNNKTLIGKIKWMQKGFTTEIAQNTKDSITIKFVDTTVFSGQVTTFRVSLNDAIHPNDSSPYNDPQKP